MLVARLPKSSGSALNSLRDIDPRMWSILLATSTSERLSANTSPIRIPARAISHVIAALSGSTSSAALRIADTSASVRARPSRLLSLGRCTSSAGGYAVLLDAWAPGWSATVDGEPVSIDRADLLVRAARVGPGEHRVVFVYRTPGLRLSAIISLLAWLNALLLAFALRRGRGL